MSLWFQTFILIGLCFILKYGSILNPIRNFLINRSNFFKKLFDCSLCLGFWVGLFFGLCWVNFFVDIVAYWGAGYMWLNMTAILISFIKAFQWAFYSSAICWLADYVTMVFDKYIKCDKTNHG